MVLDDPNKSRPGAQLLPRTTAMVIKHIRDPKRLLGSLASFCFSARTDAYKESMEQIRSRELNLSSSFYRAVFSEIEEVGWEHLVRLGEDLTYLSFRVLDKMGRMHIMEVKLDEAYPRSPPSVSAAVPCMFNLEWSIKSRLKDVVLQFQQHLEKLNELWSTLDSIDQSLWVVDPELGCYSASHRLINIGNDCFLMLFIDSADPNSVPECRFIGSDAKVNTLRKIWRRNCKWWGYGYCADMKTEEWMWDAAIQKRKDPKWNGYVLISSLRDYNHQKKVKDKPLPENLAVVLETWLPGPPTVQSNDQQIECGICYAQCLPIDGELGDRSGSGTDYTCENSNCCRAFHSLCLGDWLRSITTTRQSFNVLFGSCPYCSGPVAVKINSKK